MAGRLDHLSTGLYRRLGAWVLFQSQRRRYSLRSRWRVSNFVGWDLLYRPNIFIRGDFHEGVCHDIWLKTDNLGKRQLRSNNSYKVTIDQEIIHNWVHVEIQQLIFSLFNKKRVGLMMRLDIPIKNGNIEAGYKLSKKFLTDLKKDSPKVEASYLFGKAKASSISDSESTAAMPLWKLAPFTTLKGNSGLAALVKDW